MSCLQDPILTAEGIAWDWFRNTGSEITHYMLTHAHMDHMQGLKNVSWRTSSTKRIYATYVTQKLALLSLPNLCKDNFVMLEYGKRYQLTESVAVWPLRSYHCDGACMFFFELYAATNDPRPIQRILYTGDFRFVPEMRQSSLLTQFTIDRLYYDNTFDVIDTVYPTYTKTVTSLWRSMNSRPSVMINAAILGLEPLLRDIAQTRNVVFGLSPGLAGTYRAKQLKFLMQDFLDTSQPPTQAFILGHRRKDTNWPGHWVVPTCTFFLCGAKFKQEKRQTGKVTYVWFCTHSNRQENTQLKLLVNARNIRSCQVKDLELKCRN